MALLGDEVARECHLQNPASPLFSEVSSSGGGLPGRLDLERDSGALVILEISGFLAFNGFQRPLLILHYPRHTTLPGDSRLRHVHTRVRNPSPCASGFGSRRKSVHSAACSHPPTRSYPPGSRRDMRALSLLRRWRAKALPGSA